MWTYHIPDPIGLTKICFIAKKNTNYDETNRVILFIIEKNRMKSEFSKQVCHNYAFTWFLNCTITISGQEKRMNQSNRCIANKKKYGKH